MNRKGLTAVGAVLFVFVVAGALLMARNSGGGGRHVTYDLTLRGSSLTPTSDLQARQGDTLTISITGDKAEEIHLHLYDTKFQLEPGKTVSHTFKADRTCGCDLEIEDTGTRIGGLTVKP